MILAPVVIPLLAAAATLLLRNRLRAQRVVSLVACTAHTAAAVALLASVRARGPQVVQLGSWPAPFGISFVADLLAAIMVLLGAAMGLAVLVYALADLDEARERSHFHPLYQILLLGVSGAFLTGDLFNLYVWFEVMLMASFVLLALGGSRPQLEGALKYVTLSLLASLLFLAAAGLLYGLAGTLNLAQLAVVLPQRAESGLPLVLATLLVVSFGVKAAVFPLFGWLPASYHTPPTAISAIFAGLLTKVGVYALLRAFTLIFPEDDLARALLGWLAGLTMVTGVLGAASQGEIRRILSFHIVSQIGYMVLGIALRSPLALAGTVFYLAHHIVVKTNLFLVGGVVQRLHGTARLADLGGLAKARPLLAGLFLVPALSLAGVPPLSGFWAKLVLIRASLDEEAFVLAGTALVVGLFTLFSMTKIWAEVFWKAAPRVVPPSAPRLAAYLVPVASLAAVTVAIGLFAGPVFELSEAAAAQLLDRGAYVRLVLGEDAWAR